MKLLITGGCGFLGSNLAFAGMKKGMDIILVDNLYRKGARENLDWLKECGKFTFLKEDTRDTDIILKTVKDIKPDFIFHLAGQVAMTTSITDPRLDFETNTLGTFNILEAVRKSAPGCGIIYSSTNKVYGDLEYYNYSQKEKRYICIEKPEGFDEKTPLDFHSPYGCSKGAADQYMLDYARIFGLKTVVFRHSSMYGGRQFATYDQGWIGWFCQKALEKQLGLEKEIFTISGNGKQVRDVLHADDMINLYFKCMDNMDKAKGNAFNIGGGYANSLSLLELFDCLENLLQIKLDYKELPPRESDQKVFIADISKAAEMLKWQPEVDYKKGIRKMIEWTKSEIK